MRGALFALMLVLTLVAVPMVSAQGFCDITQPPTQGPHCELMDESVLPRVQGTVDLVMGVYGLVREYVEGSCLALRS